MQTQFFVNKNRLPVSETEKLTAKQQREECIMLALRTSQGLNLRQFQAQFGENLVKTKQKEIENLLRLNKIAIENGYLKITDFCVSNAVILELI